LLFLQPSHSISGHIAQTFYPLHKESSD
jgi:hypothetical protein